MRNNNFSKKGTQISKKRIVKKIRLKEMCGRKLYKSKRVLKTVQHETILVGKK